MLKSVINPLFRAILHYQNATFIVIKPKSTIKEPGDHIKVSQVFTSINLLKYNYTIPVQDNWLYLMKQFASLLSNNKLQDDTLITACILNEQKHNIIEKMLKEICKQTQINLQIENLITNFFTVMGKIFLKFKLWPKHRSLLQKFIFKYGQYNYLFNHDKQNCLTYLQLHVIYKKTFNTMELVHNNTSQLKICIDAFMKMKINQIQLSRFNYFIAATNFTMFYFEKNQDICNFIIQNLPQYWINDFNFTLYYLWKNIYTLSTKHMNQMNLKFLTPIQSSRRHLNFLLNLIHFKYITKQNVLKGYKEQIVQLMNAYNSQNNTRLFFMSTMNYFIYAGLWIQQYWALFFKTYSNIQFLQKDIYIYYIFMLKQLMDIDKDIIPQGIIKIANKFFKQIQSKGYKLDNFNLISTYNQKYKQKGFKIKSQHFLTASLQLGSKFDLKSEYPARLFIVDIILNGKFIIQVNNSLHYLKDQNGNRILNIKSEFRQRILKKLGYEIISIDLNDFVETSFSELISMHQKIKRCSGLSQNV